MSFISFNNSDKKRVLITGASGFIGGTLTKLLKSKNYNVIAATSRAESSDDFFFIDFQNLNAVRSALSETEPTHIIHLAGTNSRTMQEVRRKIAAKSDFQMNSNLFKAASLGSTLPNVIFLGSCEEYGVLESPFVESNNCKPITDYGQSKLKSGKLLSKFADDPGMKSTVLRPSVVYGIGQEDGMLISSLVGNLLAKNTFEIRNPMQIRDFVHVDDVTHAILLAIEQRNPSASQILNVSSGQSISVEAVVHKVISIMGTNYGKYVIFKPEFDLENHPDYYKVENKLILERLGWEPKVDFEEGLTKYIEWRSMRMTGRTKQ